MVILEANKIRKSYGNKLNKQEVLKGIDIHIEKGEFVSIMGASGREKPLCSTFCPQSIRSVTEPFILMEMT